MCQKKKKRHLRATTMDLGFGEVTTQEGLPDLCHIQARNLESQYAKGHVENELCIVFNCFLHSIETPAPTMILPSLRLLPQGGTYGWVAECGRPSPSEMQPILSYVVNGRGSLVGSVLRMLKNTEGPLPLILQIRHDLNIL